MSKSPALLVLVLLLGPSPLLRAQSWPSWRGPDASGIAAGDATPPLEWSEQKNVRWKVALPGLGASSPVVDGDRIYLTSAAETAREGKATGTATRKGPALTKIHEFNVMAFARSTGALLWKTVVTEGVPHERGHLTGTYASPSALYDGERVFAFFGSRGLFCLDRAGKVLWSKDLGQMKTLAAFGEGASPALRAGVIVVPWDHEGPSFLLALDAKTGEERWRRARDADSSWGTPLITVVGEKAQVIVSGSTVTRAYDLLTGEPVWSCDGMSKNPVNTPIESGGIAYVGNSYRGKVIQAIALEKPAAPTKNADRILWSHTKSAPYVPAPLVHDGLFYFLRDSTGVLNCLDAKTGEEIYGGQRLGLRTVHASPIWASGRIYITSRRGVTTVVKAGREFEILATNQLDDVLEATPAMIGPEIYMRGRKFLYCLAAEK